MSETPYRYTAELAERIETAWQDRWDAEGTFHAPNPSGVWAEPEKVGGREKLFVLDMFPYPSGAGLHVGHPLGYIGTDTWARFQRMQGRNVLHALGYDAFGLPAEQYAVQTGQHPRITTDANIANMRRQLRRLGLAHDDRRSVATTDVGFYRWTQWIFLQVFNSWYDAEADRARPITELVDEFAAGTRATPEGRAWSELPPAERASVIDGHRLAYLSEAPVNWCPGLGTVLANEEVTAEGRSDIGNFPVFKRNMKQWMMRITAYADRLLSDLDRLDWPDKVKAMQRNWIGRSTGASVTFAVDGHDTAIEVFTTRPDTLFGATFMVLAPEHPLVDAITPSRGGWPDGTAGNSNWTAGAPSPAEAVARYREQAVRKTDLERQENRDKSGVFTGAFAINPVNGARIPIFIADYVLMGYGTGAIMAVPAEDERDWDFAKAYGLPIIRTVQPSEGHDESTAYTGDGPTINSANDDISLNGLGTAEAKAAIVGWLSERGLGTETVTYKLRDWLFSRQRYWGEPFPIVYDEGGYPIALPDSMLPVELPEIDDYSPQALDPEDQSSEPLPPLGRVTDWAEVELDLGEGPKTYRRELNVMPQWAGSCWYEIRYLDPANDERFVDAEVERYWMGPSHEGDVGGADLGDVEPVQPGDVGGVDLYVGGVEHAVLHLLYARFWHKVLFDLGQVSSAEPFRRLYNQGYIQAHAFRDARGQTVPAEEVDEDAGADGEIHYTWQGQAVSREYGKMGKSLKNIVTPDDMYDAYGADTFRIYEMSMGPLDASKPWETRAVVGSQRFLQRLWRNVIDEVSGELRIVDSAMDDATRRILHKTIDAVRRDYQDLAFNTAIARLTEYNNALTKLDAVPREAIEPMLLMVAPLTPHIAEELWQRLGHEQTLAFEPFPEADQSLVVDDTVTCVVQVKGKVRARLEVPADITEDALRSQALALPRIAEEIANGVRTVIVRAPKLVNVVPA